MMKNILYSVVIILALVLVVIRVYNAQSQKRVLPVILSVGDFELTTQRNEKFTQDSLKNKVTLINFIFTQCPGQCPILTQKMSVIAQEFKSDQRFQAVSVTTDPDNDSADVLAVYAKGRGADIPSWHFLTGEKARVFSFMADRLKVGTTDDPAIHSQRFVIVDGKGQIRAYYDGMDGAELKNMRDDVMRLLREM